MGANCQTCDKCGKPVPETTAFPDIDDARRRPLPNQSNASLETKLKTVPSSATDEYGHYDTASSTSKNQDNIEDTDTYTYEPTDPESSTVSMSQSPTKIISAFREAVIKGDERLALYYIEEHPDLDLLSITFGNGDNCLQVAVQSLSHKLVYYLLLQGISVKYT